MPPRYVLCSLFAGSWCSSILAIDPNHCSKASENIAFVQRHAALVQPHLHHNVSDECDSCVKHLSASGGCAPLVQYEDVSEYLPAGQEEFCKRECKLDATRFCLAEEGNPVPVQLQKRVAAGESGEAHDLDNTVARKAPPPPPPPLAWGQCCVFFWHCNGCCDSCPGGNQYAWVGDCGGSRRCNPAPTRRRRYRRRRDRRRRTPHPTQHPTRHPTNTPTNDPTEHPTVPPPIYGTWAVTRRIFRKKRGWRTKRENICGESTDVLHIGFRESKNCTSKKAGATAQVIVNQYGKERSWGWFCSHQGESTLDDGYTFTPDEDQEDGACSSQHNVVDDGT